ncbi:9588_t:CDS:2 [Entrophospora sp. SA101]|nr:9588_t:CDS:2 [Entrophospora sp. SA101]
MGKFSPFVLAYSNGNHYEPVIAESSAVAKILADKTKEKEFAGTTINGARRLEIINSILSSANPSADIETILANEIGSRPNQIKSILQASGHALLINNDENFPKIQENQQETKLKERMTNFEINHFETEINNFVGNFRSYLEKAVQSEGKILNDSRNTGLTKGLGSLDLLALQKEINRASFDQSGFEGKELTEQYKELLGRIYFSPAEKTDNFDLKNKGINAFAIRALFAKHSLNYGSKGRGFEKVLQREMLEEFFLVPPRRAVPTWENELLNFLEQLTKEISHNPPSPYLALGQYQIDVYRLALERTKSAVYATLAKHGYASDSPLVTERTEQAAAKFFSYFTEFTPEQMAARKAEMNQFCSKFWRLVYCRPQIGSTQITVSFNPYFAADPTEEEVSDRFIYQPAVKGVNLFGQELIFQPAQSIRLNKSETPVIEEYQEKRIRQLTEDYLANDLSVANSLVNLDDHQKR